MVYQTVQMKQDIVRNQLISNYLFISSFVSYSNASMNASKIGKGPEWPKL